MSINRSRHQKPSIPNPPSTDGTSCTRSVPPTQSSFSAVTGISVAANQSPKPGRRRSQAKMHPSREFGSTVSATRNCNPADQGRFKTPAYQAATLICETKLTASSLTSASVRSPDHPPIVTRILTKSISPHFSAEIYRLSWSIAIGRSFPCLPGHLHYRPCRCNRWLPGVWGPGGRGAAAQPLVGEGDRAG